MIVLAIALRCTKKVEGVLATFCDCVLFVPIRISSQNLSFPVKNPDKSGTSVLTISVIIGKCINPPDLESAIACVLGSCVRNNRNTSV